MATKQAQPQKKKPPEQAALEQQITGLLAEAFKKDSLSDARMAAAAYKKVKEYAQKYGDSPAIQKLIERIVFYANRDLPMDQVAWSDISSCAKAAGFDFKNTPKTLPKRVPTGEEIASASFLQKQAVPAERAAELSALLDHISLGLELELTAITDKYSLLFKDLLSQNLPAQEKNKRKERLLKDCETEMKQCENRHLTRAHSAVDREIPGADPMKARREYDSARWGLKNASALYYRSKMWAANKWWRQDEVDDKVEANFKARRENAMKKLLDEVESTERTGVLKSVPRKP